MPAPETIRLACSGDLVQFDVRIVGPNGFLVQLPTGCFPVVAVTVERSDSGIAVVVELTQQGVRVNAPWLS